MARKATYGSAWRKARAAYLAQHPLCVECLKLGKWTPATVVDHIKPHRKDPDLFWNSDNWQSLCKHCHDSHKQRAEKSGAIIGCDAEGVPIDPDHHWQ